MLGRPINCWDVPLNAVSKPAMDRSLARDLVYHVTLRGEGFDPRPESQACIKGLSGVSACTAGKDWLVTVWSGEMPRLSAVLRSGAPQRWSPYS